MVTRFVRGSIARKYVNKQGRRLGAAFLGLLDAHVQDILDRACSTHNGSKLTLDEGVAVWVGLRGYRPAAPKPARLAKR